MTSEEWKEQIMIALGEVSMCWSEIPKGVFDSSKVIQIAERDILPLIEENKRLREALEYISVLLGDGPVEVKTNLDHWFATLGDTAREALGEK